MKLHRKYIVWHLAVKCKVQCIFYHSLKNFVLLNLYQKYFFYFKLPFDWNRFSAQTTKTHTQVLLRQLPFIFCCKICKKKRYGRTTQYQFARKSTSKITFFSSYGPKLTKRLFLYVLLAHFCQRQVYKTNNNKWPPLLSLPYHFLRKFYFFETHNVAAEFYWHYHTQSSKLNYDT